MLPADQHVHSRWSWDAPHTTSMWQACSRAVELGLPALAFTEHVDFTAWAPQDRGAADRRPLAVGSRPQVRALDVAGYAADLAQCRERFPDLRILSGIEAGEPHLFSASVAAVLAAGEFDRVLGSLHSIEYDGVLVFVDAHLFGTLPAREVVQRYFAELLRLVEGSAVFSVLAHCDYPRRCWPVASAGEYREVDFEEEYRAVFRVLASSGRALEVNTASPLVSVDLLKWWWQEGGDAVSFGSDAHDPLLVGNGFTAAVDIAEAAGFRCGRDRFDFWRR